MFLRFCWAAELRKEPFAQERVRPIESCVCELEVSRHIVKMLDSLGETREERRIVLSKT